MLSKNKPYETSEETGYLTMIKGSCVLLLLLHLGLSACATRMPLEIADSHYKNEDYAEAGRWYLQAAKQGSTIAQNNIGVMYRDGKSVARDYAEAVKWFLMAAEQGDPLAQYNLGRAYTKGEGVPQDDGEAFKWYSKAAAQGLAEAQFSLAHMYRDGKGVMQDDAIALKWARRVADQGYEEAIRLSRDLESRLRQTSFLKAKEEEGRAYKAKKDAASRKSRLPSCTSEFTKDNLLKLRADGIRLLHFKDAREESFDLEEEARRCSAIGYFATDKRKFYFNIEWIDKDKEQVYISMTVLKWPF